MSEASRPSSLHRLRRRINNGSVLRSVRSFSLKRKKPISIAIIAVLIFAILLTTILIVVLRQSGNNSDSNPPKNIQPEVASFLFNIGYKDSPVAQKLVNQMDEGRLVLKKAINGLAENITNGDIVIQLIPYADSVLEDKIEEGLDSVGDILKIIDKLFAGAPPLEHNQNPSQFDAVTYYLNTTEGLKFSSEEKSNFLSFASDTNKKNTSFVFMAPKQDLYESNEARIYDSHQTGSVLQVIASKVSKPFLVGLNDNKDMASDYGLTDGSINVLPDGINDVDEIVHDIKDNNPVPVITTTQKTTVITKSSTKIPTETTSKSSPILSTRTTHTNTPKTHTSTQKSTHTSTQEVTTEFTEEPTTEHTEKPKNRPLTKNEPKEIDRFYVLTE